MVHGLVCQLNDIVVVDLSYARCIFVARRHLDHARARVFRVRAAEIVVHRAAARLLLLRRLELHLAGRKLLAEARVKALGAQVRLPLNYLFRWIVLYRLSCQRRPVGVNEIYAGQNLYDRGHNNVKLFFGLLVSVRLFQ